MTPKSSSLFTIALLLLVVLSVFGVSAQQQDQIDLVLGVDDVGNSTKTSQTDASICAMKYLQNLKWSNTSNTPAWNYMISISPCNKVDIYTGYDPKTQKSSGTNCGLGFASWIEDTAGHRDTCHQFYNKNATYMSNTRQTRYFDSVNNDVLTVTWDCTGLQGDLDASKTSITAVSGSDANRQITVTTKGCIRPENNELRAGVIVAIVVVAVFVLAVIVSVVKAKCFGSGATAGSTTLGGAGSSTGQFGGGGAKSSNIKFSAAASNQSGNEIATTNYQAMP